MASFPIFITSFNILSKPGDLFAFSLLIAASNSSSVIGQSSLINWAFHSFVTVGFHIRLLI